MKVNLRENFQSLDLFKRTLPCSDSYYHLSSVALVTQFRVKAANGQSFAKWLQIIFCQVKTK